MSALIPKRSVLLIDGGHLRARAHLDGFEYTADFIEKCAASYIRREDTLIRVLYYDCSPFIGEKKKPISEEIAVFENSSEWLTDLAAREKFAVRLGVLKWRGWKPKRTPMAVGRQPTDEDFIPDLEQKGVDLRIGLDIAVFAQTTRVDRIILLTADTDLIPAMKHGRRAGLEMVGIELPRVRLLREMKAHLDSIRPASWPNGAAKRAPKPRAAATLATAAS